MTQPPAPASVMPALSAFVAGAAARPLPPEVVEKTKQHVLNTLACMISGTTLEPGRLAIEMVRDYGGAPHACIPGTNLVALGEIAAFANGMTARAGESDDLHARSRIHPGASIVPAALAMAERAGASGERLLRAVCAGYDVGCTDRARPRAGAPRGPAASARTPSARFGARRSPRVW